MTRKHAVVFGGTKGLGRVVAGRLAKRDLDVTIVSRSVPDPASGFRHFSSDLETLDEEAARALVEAMVEAGGTPSYVVFSQRFRGVGDIWAGEIQVGLTATRLLIEALKPHFNVDGDAAVAIVSSVYADFVGSSQPVGYHVVKAGLNQMMRYYAWELGRMGIRSNAVMPLSYIKPESRTFYQSKPELTDLYDKFVPLRRMGSAEDSADLIDFLCSDKAAFINGQAIFVDGGVSVTWQEEVAKSLTNL